MSDIKKVFRGYKVSDVDAKIAELEKQIDDANTQRQKLERKLSEANNTIEIVNSKLNLKEQELLEVRQDYKSLQLQYENYDRGAQVVGSMYIKAFQTGKEIANAPKVHVDNFLEGVSEIVKKAGNDFDRSKDDFSSMTTAILDDLKDINQQTEAVRNRAAKLLHSLQKINDVYSKIENIHSLTGEQINKLIKAYENEVGDYFDNGDKIVDFAPHDVGVEPSNLSDAKPKPQDYKLEQSDIKLKSEDTNISNDDLEHNPTLDTIAKNDNHITVDKGLNKEKKSELGNTEIELQADTIKANMTTESIDKNDIDNDTASDFVKPNQIESANDIEARNKKEQALHEHNIINLLSKYSKSSNK